MWLWFSHWREEKNKRSTSKCYKNKQRKAEIERRGDVAPVLRVAFITYIIIILFLSIFDGGSNGEGGRRRRTQWTKLLSSWILDIIYEKIRTPSSQPTCHLSQHCESSTVFCGRPLCFPIFTVRVFIAGAKALHVHSCQVLKMDSKCNGQQNAWHLQYLPYNGRQHSLIWEKEANDLDETREQELILK